VPAARHTEVKDVLILRELGLDDEFAAEAAHERLAAEGFPFLLDRDRAGSFGEYLELLERQRTGRDPHPGRVRASFLGAEVDGEIVGRVSIRHELNEHLEREGGHIGFTVIPDHRRRGYASQILRRSLDLLAADGLATALLTCDDDNVASAATIERCGGELVGRVEVNGVLVRHYHVPTTS
jgi:predicted acetyltransferase